MKEIKIAYVGYHVDFDYESDKTYELLSKHYTVKVVNPTEAEYIFCSLFVPRYEYLKYNQIRIMWSGENYIPDLNLVDYAISPYPISFYDRFVYYPIYAQSYGRLEALASKNRNFTLNDIKEKEFFANFIASHESEYNLRGDFLNFFVIIKELNLLDLI